MCTTPNKEYADMLDVPAKPARPYTRNSPLPQTEEHRIEQMTDRRPTSGLNLFQSRDWRITFERKVTENPYALDKISG